MKKKVLYVLLIILSICLIGCSKNSEVEEKSENNDYNNEIFVILLGKKLEIKKNIKQKR